MWIFPMDIQLILSSQTSHYKSLNYSAILSSYSIEKHYLSFKPPTMNNHYEEHHGDEWTSEEIMVLVNALDDIDEEEGGTSKPPTMKNHQEEHHGDYGWTSEEKNLLEEALDELEPIGSRDGTDEEEGGMSNPLLMKNHHEEHHSDDDDGWTFEDVKILESALGDDAHEEIGGTSKKRRVIKQPRAKAIPWKEHEHK